jgi:hypothetical protein
MFAHSFKKIQFVRNIFKKKINDQFPLFNYIMKKMRIINFYKKLQKFRVINFLLDLVYSLKNH